MKFGLHTITGAALAIGVFSASTLHGEEPAKAQPASTRVGVFDSRAIALAYYRSAEFQKLLGALKTELEEAVAAGDDERVATLEKKGPELQSLAHRQGFGTAPVDDIIATLGDSLADIADEAGVDLIVSKWQLAYERGGTDLKDVTSLLVQRFDPSPATLETIDQIMAKEPVPAGQLEDSGDG